MTVKTFSLGLYQRGTAPLAKSYQKLPSFRKVTIVRATIALNDSQLAKMKKSIPDMSLS